MPAIPSLIQRVAANDRLQKLKAISRRVYDAFSSYHFGHRQSYWDSAAFGVAATYSLYKHYSHMHRQLFGRWYYEELFNTYVKENVI